MKIGGKIRGVPPVAIGNEAKPVIFTHVGVISEYDSKEELDKAIDMEVKKAIRAIELGADAICDVSTNSQMSLLHERLAKTLDVPLGVVSIYETFVRIKKEHLDISEDVFLFDIKNQIERGVDLITLHATVFKNDRPILESSNRLIPTTSRGGMLMLELIEEAGFENPYYTHFDDILLMCHKFGVSISLAPMYRPASVVDATENDVLHIMELTRMSELVKKAIDRGVTVMIEGIGHASLNDIPRLIETAKRLCPNAAYRIMPVATDIAIGFDHISSAIAAATAIRYGADSVTCVTRKEHIGLPGFKDMEEGVIASKIATYIGYSSRTGDFSRDSRMSSARKNNGCLGDMDAALFSSDVYSDLIDRKMCSMCGAFCPLRKFRDKEKH